MNIATNLENNKEICLNNITIHEVKIKNKIWDDIYVMLRFQTI